MNRFPKLALLCICLSLCSSVFAVIETYSFSDTQLEQRYRRLSGELRCPKCQNQNIADSNAPIAQDLRKLLYEQLEAGASDEEILDDMVSRYGEFVRYRPRFGGVTLALWIAPVVLLLLGLSAVTLVLRASTKNSSTRSDALSDAEQAQLNALLSPDLSSDDNSNSGPGVQDKS